MNGNEIINDFVAETLESSEPVAVCDKCENWLWIVVMGAHDADGQRGVAKYRCANPDCGHEILIGKP